MKFVLCTLCMLSYVHEYNGDFTFNVCGSSVASLLAASLVQDFWPPLYFLHCFLLAGGQAGHHQKQSQAFCGLEGRQPLWPEIWQPEGPCLALAGCYLELHLSWGCYCEIYFLTVLFCSPDLLRLVLTELFPFSTPFLQRFSMTFSSQLGLML